MKMNESHGLLNAFYQAYKSELRIWFCYTWVVILELNCLNSICSENFSASDSVANQMSVSNK